MSDVVNEPRSVAFVGSLLPVRFLLERSEALNVRRIVVLNRTHERSYQYLCSRLPASRVSRLAGGPLAAAALLAGHLMTAKLLRRRVVFFHECCWPLFDLLVCAVRPLGLFVPHVTMDGFDTISVDDMPPPASLMRRLIVALFKRWLRRFIVYRSPKDSGEHGYNYLLAIRSYPDSIRVAPVWRPPQLPQGPSPVGTVPRILLVGGTEPVPDDVMRRLYAKVVDVGRAEGYDVFFKDHPMNGIRFEAPSCTAIDPALPMELITERFAFSIGVASTGIFGSGDRQVSIMNLLEAIPAPVREVRRKRLLSHPSSDPARIEFVDDIAALRRILRDARSVMSARD